MQQEEKLEPNSPLPVLPRLDRLDRLLQLLEEKHGLSGKHSCSSVDRKMEAEDQCKSLSTALEEVHHKGTLMERLAILENRVLQLALEMDEGNTSRSSSSTVPVYENSGHLSGPSSVTKQDEDAMDTLQGKQDAILIQEEAFAQAAVTKPCQNGRRHKRKAYRKWRGWFRMGC